MWVRSMGQEDPLEKGMATHSCVLTQESSGLQSMGLRGVEHNSETNTVISLSK